MNKVVDVIVECLRGGNKVLVFGVGGNAANAMHFAAELSGKFEQYEKPLACVCLCDDPCIITAITNDFGWEHCYERQIIGLGKPEDVVVAFSISGGGSYLLNAFKAARSKGCRTVLINGRENPDCKDYCDVIVSLGSDDTPWVQEEQLRLVHQICREVKKRG